MRFCGWVLLLLTFGCSSQLALARPTTPDDRDRANALLAGREATLVLRAGGGTREVGENERGFLGEQSFVFLPEGAQARAEVPALALERIHILDRARGSREGLGFGALAGVTIGAVPVALAFGKNNACNCGEGRFAAVALAGGTTLLGGLLGLFLGGAIGHRTEIRFEPTR